MTKKNNKPLICISGKVSLNEKEYNSLGISKAWASSPLNYPLEKSMENAYMLLKNKAEVAIKIYLNQKQ